MLYQLSYRGLTARGLVDLETNNKLAIVGRKSSAARPGVPPVWRGVSSYMMSLRLSGKGPGEVSRRQCNHLSQSSAASFRQSLAMDDSPRLRRGISVGSRCRGITRDYLRTLARAAGVTGDLTTKGHARAAYMY